MEKLKKVARQYYQLAGENRKFALSAILFYTLGFFVTELMRPYLIKMIIDGLINKTMSRWNIIGWFVLLTIVLNALLRLADRYMALFLPAMTQTLLTSSTEQVLKYPFDFFTTSRTGKLPGVIRRFSNSFETAFEEIAYRISVTLLYVVGMTIIACSVNWYLGLIIFTFVTIMFTISFVFFKRKLIFDESVAKTESHLNNSLNDITKNISTIIAGGRRSQEASLFSDVVSGHIKNVSATRMYGNKARLVKAVTSNLFHVVMMYFLVSFYFAGNITIGTVTLFISYMFSISGVLWSFDGSLKTLSKSTADAVEMVTILETPIEIQNLEEENEDDVEPLNNPSIVLENVSFQYPNNKALFDNLNIIIPSGQKVGICGASGTGKTTLIQLILRIRETTSGRILIDNKSIKEGYSEAQVKGLISYIPQKTEMFNRSIFENIAIFKQDATLDEVMAAAKRARIHKEIMKLKNQYNSKFGEHGVNLSGGQIQRIGIARAILKNASIVIVDEGTSALDPITESKILQIFNKEFEGKTVVVIAHRLSTIRNLDRILVLDNGSVVQDGTHNQLLAQEGVYADMISANEIGNTIRTDDADAIRYTN